MMEHSGSLAVVLMQNRLLFWCRKKMLLMQKVNRLHEQKIALCVATVSTYLCFNCFFFFTAAVIKYSGSSAV